MFAFEELPHPWLCRVPAPGVWVRSVVCCLVVGCIYGVLVLVGNLLVLVLDGLLPPCPRTRMLCYRCDSELLGISFAWHASYMCCYIVRVSLLCVQDSPPSGADTLHSMKNRAPGFHISGRGY